LTGDPEVGKVYFKALNDLRILIFLELNGNKFNIVRKILFSDHLVLASLYLDFKQRQKPTQGTNSV